MPHIHTQDGQHDQTASAYIIRLDGREPRVLLHRHKKLGVYTQFGGHVELHETPWQAIAHELQEESGYSLDQLSILQPQQRLLKLTRATSHPLPINLNTHAVHTGGKHFHTDIVYAFVTNEDPKGSPDDGESHDMQLFTKAELQAISSEEIFENVRELGLFVLDVIMGSWDEIPAGSI